MITKKTKALLLSTMTLMLCVVLISTATFALYTQSTTITHHLQAGRLELQLWRVGVAQCTMDEQGYLITKTYSQNETTPSGHSVLKNFTKGADGDNFFGLKSVDAAGKTINHLVPGAWFETTMKLVNNGDVAFRYSIEVHLGQEAFTPELLKHTIMTVTPYDKDMNEIAGKSVSYSLEKWIGQNDAPFWGVFAKNDSEQYVKVRISFEDVDGVSGFEGSGVNFDLVVKAEQLTTAVVTQ